MVLPDRIASQVSIELSNQRASSQRSFRRKAKCRRKGEGEGRTHVHEQDALDRPPHARLLVLSLQSLDPSCNAGILFWLSFLLAAKVEARRGQIEMLGSEEKEEVLPKGEVGQGVATRSKRAQSNQNAWPLGRRLLKYAQVDRVVHQEGLAQEGRLGRGKAGEGATAV